MAGLIAASGHFSVERLCAIVGAGRPLGDAWASRVHVVQSGESTNQRGKVTGPLGGGSDSWVLPACIVGRDHVSGHGLGCHGHACSPTLQEHLESSQRSW